MQEYQDDEAPFLDDLATRRVALSASPKYQQFLADLCRLGPYDEAFAERAATAVLCVFEQQLSAGNVKNPDDTLPDALRELVLGCSRTGEIAGEAFDSETLIFSVADDLNLSDAQAEAVVGNVFHAVRKQLTHGQAGYVARKLPAKIQNLWFGHEHAERRPLSGKPRDR